MKETKEVIMIRFLRKLMNLNMWGGKHTEETHISLNPRKKKEISEFLEKHS